MALGDAHQGYSYQDLLCCYFILDDVIRFNTSDFFIDLKEYKEDRFDDLTINHSDAVYKKQFKYSNEKNNHTLTKDDLANDGNYQLALFSLYKSWVSSSKPKTYVRLCLAWNIPDINLGDLMEELYMEGSFPAFKTRVFQFDIEKFWPVGGTPPKGWNKFKQQKIDHKDFSEFLKYLTIELELPKFSEDLYQPGALEKLVLDKVESLGMGYYPNDHYKKQEFASALLAKVRKHRSSGVPMSTADFYDYFRIKTDYGAIQQVFPVNENQKIETISIYEQLISELANHQRISLTGEPGMGKSWLVENFKKHIAGTEIHLIRHLCYTDISDQLQTQRIQINVLYANLIKEILDVFPKLKGSKSKVYASDLHELNLLLAAIDEDTILVIDGIDHIERIYQFRNLSIDLNRSEIDILHAINKLKPSAHVKILAISQPITELKELDNFYPMSIPRWGEAEIESYLLKCGVDNILIDGNQKLSQYLNLKVAGNPLYLRYIVEELHNLDQIDFDHLQQIPVYDSGLRNYYQYLLGKLNLKEQIPRILSGVSFSVTLSELQEITGEGNLVSESLDMLKPVIKLNVSQNGYSIYHESFRRFIIDQLISNQISIEKTVYNPIISWFEEKGIFTYPKSYRFYFQYIHESGKLEKALEFATIDFVWNSAFHGHHWEIIANNLKYINKAVLNMGSIPQLFIITELSRVISMTEDAFKETLLSYLKAVGNLEGFQKVADYLVYEGSPTLSLELGLKACQLCFLNNMQAPWQVYLDYFRGANVEITTEMFSLILTHRIENEDEEKIIHIADGISKNENSDYKQVFSYLFEEYYDRDFIQRLISSNTVIAELLIRPASPKLSKMQLINLRNEVKDIDHFSSRDIDALDRFVKAMVEADDKECQECIGQLKSINWFYNWVIFLIETIKLGKEEQPDQHRLAELFKMLTYDTEPFKGKPRTSDLHSIKDWIHQSFEDAIKLVNDAAFYPKLIEALIKVSDETTTSLQKSLGGPLPTDKLFSLLCDCTNEENWQYISEKLEEELLDKSQYHLHSYIAEYHFNLTSIYAGRSDDKAVAHLKEGLKFTLGYTFRKDMTIEDLLNSVESLNKVDNTRGMQAIKELLALVYSVVNHTDGKETQYFPIEWFEKYAAIAPDDSKIYLLNSLADTRLDWRLEKCLENLLISLNGSVDIQIEYYLSRTLPLATSYKFLNYSMGILQQVAGLNEQWALKYLGTVYEKFKVTFRNEISVEQANILRAIIGNLDIDDRIDISLIRQRKPYNSPTSTEKILVSEFRSRRDFSEMSAEDMVNYLQDNEITDRDYQSLFYRVRETNVTPDEYKKIIDALFSGKYKYKRQPQKLNKVFEDSGNMQIYFQVSRFVNDLNENYQSLVNKEAFDQAFKIRADETLNVLRQLLEKRLDKGYSMSLSGNLFNALAHASLDKKELVESWSNMYNAIAERLPVTEPIDWSEMLSFPVQMDKEELLIALLITRFKIGTTERYQWTLAGVADLLQRNPERMIKPFKFFFSTWKNYENAIQVTIVQLIYEYGRENPGYGKHFHKELESIYPLRHFMIDIMIEKLLGKSPRRLIAGPAKLRYPFMDDNEMGVFMRLNHRHTRLEFAFVDLEQAFQKTRANFKTEVNSKKTLEIYANRSHEMYVSNIYFADYILKTINTELYEDLYESFDRDEVLDSTRLVIKSIVAYTQSICPRDKKLVRPSQIHEPESRKRPDAYRNWVRLGHYEKEFHGETFERLIELTVFSAVQFTDKEKVSYPFSQYRIPEDGIFTSQTPFRQDREMVFLNRETDGLEDYILIWLHSSALAHLKLKIKTFNEGLSAVDEDGNLGLVFNSWKSDYVGLGVTDRLSDEIPKLSGGELLIREDLYQQLEQWSGKSGWCFTKKISNGRAF